MQGTNCYSDHSGVASDDGTIYLFGGYSEFYEAQSTVVKVQVSDDDELTFSTAEPMGQVIFCASCSSLLCSVRAFWCCGLYSLSLAADAL